MAKLIRRRRKDGTLSKMIYGRLQINGKDTWRALSTNDEIAHRKLAQLISKRDAGKQGQVSINSTIDDFLEDDFWPWSRQQKPQTYSAHQRAFKELRKAYPVRYMKQITPRLLQKLYLKWKEQGRGLYVRNKDLRSLKAAMRKAEEWGYFTEKQLWETAKGEVEPLGRYLWYSEDQLRDLAAVCHGVWETIFLLGIGAGMRRSEIFYLPLDHVDFKNRRIFVGPVYDENGKLLWEPKRHPNQPTQSRYIPMTDFLAKHLAFVLSKKTDRWVISENGERPTVGAMTQYFGRLSRKAGLKGNLHTLRHSFASHLASRGETERKIGKLLGHTKPTTTQIYTKLSDQSLVDAVNRLPQI